ncbi:MAG: hypothetical protein AAFP90_01135 [Planctomycetota bacterium]
MDPTQSSADRAFFWGASKRHLGFGIATVVLLVGGGAMYWWAMSGADILLRAGLLCGAIALAYPQLRRPARWLPAGGPVIVLIALAAICVQPRLALVILPIAASLLTIAWFVKAFLGK